MSSSRFLVFVIILAFLSTYSMVKAQVLSCMVNVQMEHLQPREQDDLSDLQQKLTDYLNSTKWSEENQDIILNCNVQLIIETVTTRGSEKVYKAQYLVNSPSGENFYDKTFEFAYHPGQAFQAFRNTFDPLLDMADFYAYLVIGGEMDTYELMGGNPFYDKAQAIANQGQLSNYSLGWTRRLEDAIEITDGSHVPLREAKFYYYEGLYFVENEPNPQNARQLAEAVVNRLEQVHNKRPNSKTLKRFLDAHYQEMCKLFKYDESRDNINKMIEIDARHRTTYEECDSGA